MNPEGLSTRARHVLLGHRQCIGTNRDGQRCNKAPMIGQFVCANHGGKTPLGQRAAREFLDGLREPAIEVLYRATRNAPPCEHCGRSDADRDPTAVRAALAVLDRTGHGPSATLEVVPKGPDYSGLTLSQLADRAEAAARRLRADAEAEAERLEVEAGLLLVEGDGDDDAP